jgi:hypothetical protein
MQVTSLRCTSGLAGQAPHLRADAFQVDVKGKVVIMLAGGPDLRAASDLGFGWRPRSVGAVNKLAAAKAGAIGVPSSMKLQPTAGPAQAEDSIRVPARLRAA